MYGIMNAAFAVSANNTSISNINQATTQHFITFSLSVWSTYRPISVEIFIRLAQYLE